MLDIKKTQVTELLCNIRATLVSFISIVMFVALGVALFLGIGWMAPDLNTTADAAFDQGTFYDISIFFPYGLTDVDTAALKQVEDVSTVEVSRSAYLTSTDAEGNKYTVKAMALTSEINLPIQLEGTLPTATNEVALQKLWANNHGVSIGDTITFESPSKDTDYLATETFTVTALVESSAYLSTQSDSYGVSNLGSGHIDILAYVAPETFKADTYYNAYTDVYVRCDELRGLSTFSDEYKEAAETIRARIEELGETLGTARYDSLHQSAADKLQESRDTLDDAIAQIEEAEKLIAEGEETIASSEAQIESGEATLASLYRRLVSGEATLEDARSQYSAVQAQVEEYEAKLQEFDSLIAQAHSALDSIVAYKDEVWNNLYTKLTNGEITQEEFNEQVNEACNTITEKINEYSDLTGIEIAPGTLTVDNFNEKFAELVARFRSKLNDAENLEITIDGQTMTIAEARQKIADAKDELAEKKTEIDNGAAELESGWSQYYSGQQQIASAKEQVESGKQEIEDRKAQVEDGKTQVEEGEAQYAEAQEKLAAMKEYGWSVTGRSYNGGIQTIDLIDTMAGNMRLTMASLFLIVGLLVCYSAVSRIVHEQITQLGTKKALGFRASEITMSYLAYSGIAVLIGVVLGALLAVLWVEQIILGTMTTRFIFESMPLYFSLPDVLTIGALELVLILAATWFACRGVLKRQAKELLAGEPPASAKPRFFESWAAWKKLPLFSQTVINNCLNDRRRVASTLIGIAGATALIVTAITLNDDVLASLDRQYENVYSFNAIAYCDAVDEDKTDDEVAAATDATKAALSNLGATSTPIYRSYYTLELPNNEQSLLTVIVPQDDATFGEFLHVNARYSEGNEYSSESNGVWITAAYAEHQNAHVGDTLTISTTTGEILHLTIAGFYEYYLTGFQMVMPQAIYEEVFGEAAANALLVNTNGMEVTEVSNKLTGTENFNVITNDYLSNRGNFDAFANLSHTVVAVYLALAVVMALVVLLNLNMMFVSEKKRELIVLMINGYSAKQAKAYIYRDSIVLTILGIICGLILGAAMGYITVLSVETVHSTYVKDIDTIACIAGAVGSAVLAVIMNLIALRQIPRLDLTDINRF